MTKYDICPQNEPFCLSPCHAAGSHLNLTSIDPRGLLHKHFGFRDFLEGREGVVRAILEGQDVLCIMPTGGKSLCYELLALALQGMEIGIFKGPFGQSAK